MDSGRSLTPHVEGVGQGHGDLDGGIGVVALAHVQEPGDAADIAQFLVKEPELAAGQGQHDRILRGFFHKFGVIVAARLGAVAAAHQEEVADGLILHRLDDLAGHAHDGVAAKADHDRLPVGVFGETGQGQGLFNGRGEIFVGDVGDSRPADQTGGEDIVLIGLLRFLDAVGGHDDGAGEFGEFLLLILPGGAVVAVEMGIFLQSRIAVERQHLAVGIDGDALSLRSASGSSPGPSGRGRRPGWPCLF